MTLPKSVQRELAELQRRGVDLSGATIGGKPIDSVLNGDDAIAFTHYQNRLCITVPGIPIGKPRMTKRDKWEKRPEVVRYRDWCNRLTASLGALPPADSVMSLDWVAYFMPPESWSKKKRNAAIGALHRQKPDRDNIDKAILDCLFHPDSAIAAGTIRKEWDWKARLEIVIVFREST